MKPIVVTFLKAIAWTIGLFVGSRLLDLYQVMSVSVYEGVILALLAGLLVSFYYYAKNTRQKQKDIARLNAQLRKRKKSYLRILEAPKHLTRDDPSLILSTPLHKGSQFRVTMEGNEKIDASVKMVLFEFSHLGLGAAATINSAEGVPRWQWEDVVRCSGVWYFVARLPEDVQRSSVEIAVDELVLVGNQT